jgi:hypothetical protein
MKVFNKLKFNRLSVHFWGYVLVILAIIIPWLLKSGYLFFTDNAWGPNINLNWASSLFLFNFLIKSLSFVLPIAFLEKIFIAGVLILILLGGRILVKTVLEYYNKVENLTQASRGLIFVLSLFALFNPFVYDRALYGQFGVLMAYGCLLFAVAYLFKTWQTLNFKNLYLAAIFSALALMFSVHFIFLFSPLYLLFIVSLFFKKVYRQKKFWLALLLAVIIVLAINANWLIALATSTSPLNNFIAEGITNQDLIAFQTSGKTPLQTFTNVLLMSGFWGKDQYRYLDLTTITGWQRSFILLIPLILYGVFLSFRKRSPKEKIFSLGLILIFGLAIFLALGIKAPLTRGLTLFLYNHLPFYKGLREPQKWVAVIIPIYLFYLTLGTWHLTKTKVINNNLLTSGLVLGVIIVMQASLLLWGFSGQIRPTNYPTDWQQTNTYIKSQDNCSKKILFLPWHMYMSFNWLGNIVINPAPTFFTCPVINGTNMEWGGIYDNSTDKQGQAIELWLNTHGANKEIINNLNIGYIVMAKEVDWQAYDWLGQLKYIKLIKSTKTLMVYEIES